jgi:hypothetical protein
MKEVSQVFDKDLALKTEIVPSKDKVKEILPEIKVDSGSDESMEHYFPEAEVTQDEVKSRFASLFGKINEKRDKSNVIGSPNIAQVGLQPSASSSKLLSPLQLAKDKLPVVENTFESSNNDNKFEADANLFEDSESSNVSTVDELPSFANKGKGKESFDEVVKADHQIRKQASIDSMKQNIDLPPID